MRYIKLFEEVKDNTKCPKCGNTFNYLSVPESGMGYIKCPTCEYPITQDTIQEKNNSISLLCVEIGTKFAEDKFTIGKLYDAVPLNTAQKIRKSMTAAFDYNIIDDKYRQRGLLKLMNVDEYVCTIGGKFTKDKSLEDYHKRKITQQFDL